MTPPHGSIIRFYFLIVIVLVSSLLGLGPYANRKKSFFSRIVGPGDEVSNGSTKAAAAASVVFPPPYPWQFIHPEKTGTSFVNTMYMLGCPEDYRANWTKAEVYRHAVHAQNGIAEASSECKQRWVHGGRHGAGHDWDKTRPVRPEWWLGEHAYRNKALADEQLFMVFREPVDRIISQLLFQKRNLAKRLVTLPDSEIAEYLINRIKRQMYDSVKPDLGQHMTSFFFQPAGPGKIKWHNDSGALQSMTERACQVVQNMAWVGLTGAFNQSNCLLHARVDFPRHPFELINMRPTKQKLQKDYTMNITLIGILIRNKITITDDVIYDCAQQRFLRDLKQWAPHCL